MKKKPISVFIITQDEEKNIERALKSAQFADEIIVVDSGSTDKTVEIIKSFGVEPIHNDWLGYAKQKQFAMLKCRNDWVLNLDADEEIPEDLARRFQTVANEDKYTSVRCLRTDIFMNGQLSALSKRPNNLRFYKKSCAQFDTSKLVHESATVKGKQLSVSESLIHYGYGNIEVVTQKKNLYSSLKAREKHKKKKRFSYLKLILIFPFVFIQQLLFQGKIFSGVRGLVLSVIQAHYAFIKEAKLYEHHVKDK